MQQQVNLFQSLFRRELPPLPTALIAKLAAAALVALAVASAYAAFSAWRPRGDEAALEVAKLEAVHSLVKLEAQANESDVETELGAAIHHLTREASAKRQLLSALSEDGRGSTRGFSDYMTALARQRVDGLWLRRFHVYEGGERLALMGYARVPEAVPTLLELLGREAVFKGRTFRRFRLDRSDEPHRAVEFMIRTHREEEPG